MKRLTSILAAIVIAVVAVAQTKMELAHQALDNDDFNAVIQYTTEQLKTSPKDANALVLRAIAFLSVEDYDAALKDINASIKNHDKKCEYPLSTCYCLRALIHESKNDLQAAFADYNTAIKNDKKSTRAYKGRANLYYSQDMYAEAEADYRKAYSLDNTDTEAAIEVARCLLQQEKNDEAIVILDNIIKYEPMQAEAKRLRAMTYMSAEDDKTFIDLYVDYLAMQHGDLDFLLFAASNEYGYALKVVTNQLKKASSDEDRFYWLGVRARIYQVKKQYEEALSDLRAMETMIPDTVVNFFILSQSATCYDGLYQYDDAIGRYTKLIDELRKVDYPTDYYAFRRGYCYEMTGKYENAIADYTEVINDNTDYTALAYCRRGTAKYYSGSAADAVIEDYNKGLLFDENDNSCLIMRGKILITEVHDTLRANRDFEQILEVDTTLNSNYTCRHYALMYLGREEEAIEWVNKILEADPTAGNYYDAACLYARMNRPEEAMRHLKTAFEKGYRAFYHIETDDDLDSIRQRQDFIELINQYQKAKVSNMFNKLRQ